MSSRGAAGATSEAMRRLFVVGAAVFVVAGLTGSLMRFGMLHGFPFDWQLVNLRHAHSHLMYFGWVTPALFALIGALVAERSGRSASAVTRTGVGLAVGAALLSFWPFLQSGYAPTMVGGLRLPLSMIASTLALLAWTVWVAGYAAATWRLPRDLALLALDMAVLALLVACAGAWGLAAAAVAPMASALWMDRLIPFYLGVFSSGWFALAVVGLMADRLRARFDPGLGRVAVVLLWVGTLGAAIADLLIGGSAWPASLARLVGAGGAVVLGLQFVVAGRRATRPGVLLLGLLLVGKGLMDGASDFGGFARWSEQAALPIWLAHAYLLGLVTLALVWLALHRWRPQARWWFWAMAASVAVLLVGILPLTQAWPFTRGSWLLPFAAWTSLAPSVAMVAVAAVLGRPEHAEARS